jgi:hypothetical protein
MRRASVVCGVGVAVVLLAAQARAGWMQVLEADGALDLPAARRAALAVVAAEPTSADAVASAGWWLENLDTLTEPEAILAAAPAEVDPELAFVLARIAATIRHTVPAGTLPRAQLSGPWGRYDTLDLERGVVPIDAELPPLGSPSRGPGHAYHLDLSSHDGWIGPPERLAYSGVYLAGWTLHADREVDGWLVVEARGSYNLELDGVQVDRRRDCGLVDPATVWYRVGLQAGRHRVRIEMASRELPAVRLSLLGVDGAPVAVSVQDGGQGLSGSRARVELPPASAAVGEAVGSERDRLLAAALSSLRRDQRERRRWLEGALAASPNDPLAHLEMAAYLMSGSSGSALVEDLRQAQEHLRAAAGLARSRLLAHSLAHLQRRAEDGERLLEELLESAADDPRVMRRWVREAVRRGWVGEAEDALARLREVLPGSTMVTELRLEVLEGLERWQERNHVLGGLAGSEPVRLEWVEELASGCRLDEALQVLEQVRARSDSLDLELMMIRLLMENGRREHAARELARLRERWGAVPALDGFEIALAANDPATLDAAVASVLEANPGDLRTRALGWRLGREPFFAPFRVEAEEVEAALADAEVGDVDAILLLDQAVERIFPDGSSIYYYHGLTRALTPQGARQAARLQQMDDALVLDVRIVKPDGREVVPPEVAPGVTNLELHDVAPGDLVEEEYVAAVAGTRGGHLSPYVYRFADPERAFGLSEYILLVPDGVELKVEGRFEGLERTEWRENGHRVIRWRAETVPPLTPEPFAPPVQELLPWVTYGFGVDWSDVGDAVRDQVLPVLRDSHELRAWSEPLVAEGDAVEVVRRLVAAVCDEVERGPVDLDLRTTAGASFGRRGGNRLAIVASVLDRAGFEVDLVLARPLELAGTHLGVPSMDAFHLPVLRAVRDDDVVWLDLSEERRGVDHLAAVLQGSDGLVLPLSSPARPVSLLPELPSFANPDLEERLTLHARVLDSGTALMEFEMPMRGAQAERLLQQVRSVPEERVPMVYRQLAASLFPAAEDVEGELNRVGERVVLTFDATLPGACEVGEQAMVCRAMVLAKPLAPVLTPLPERRFPLVIALPVLQRVELDLALPEGWAPAARPRRLETSWGSVTEELEVEHGRLHSVLSLRIDARVVDPADYPEFARFCHAVDELMSRAPRLQRVY